MLAANALEAELALIWARNLATQHERLDQVRAAVASLDDGDPDVEIIRTGMTAAHKLAGSLGAFGLPRASRAAARLESLLSRATSSSASAMRLYRLIAHIATDLAQEPRRSLGAEDLRSEMATAAPTERVDFVVIDDDAVFAEAIAAWSLAYGYNTRCFGDGESAVLALAGETPSVQPSAILLDVDLPGLSGYDVLGRLESAGILARTPVIMLTQKSTSPDVLRALEYQIRGYVAKPVPWRTCSDACARWSKTRAACSSSARPAPRNAPAPSSAVAARRRQPRATARSPRTRTTRTNAWSRSPTRSVAPRCPTPTTTWGESSRSATRSAR